MNRKILGIFIVTLLIATAISAINSVSACTGFTASEGEKVLVGTTFDWSQRFDIYRHYFPAEEGKYGRVIIDFKFPMDMEPYNDPDWILPKEGMNDQGLFYSLFLTPHMVPENSNDKPIFSSDDPDYYSHAIPAYCIAKCTTVAEVLDVYDDYNLLGMANSQCFFADRNGDSVIIEGDDIIYKEGDFQVASNFLQNHPDLGGIADAFTRYNTAVSMIENMTDLSDEYFRTICNATHISNTVFSNVYDLKQGIFYMNYNNNFEKTLEFDLNEELAKGERRVFIGSLFDSEDNNPPGTPNAPTGVASGEPGVDYEFKGKETDDPDGDRTMYLFDWGDGTDSGWLNPSMTGLIKSSHNWSERGDYEIKLKAMDIYGRESEWSDPLSVTMPKNKVINTPFLNFLEQHPHMFPLLQHLLRL